MRTYPLLLGYLLLLMVSVVQAAERVQVLALFPGKAMLQVDGQRKVLAAGEALNGVLLLGANPREALVEINGEKRTLALGSAVSASYQPAQGQEIRIIGDGRSFFLDGQINGQSIRMLVDTGATSVALSERHANLLGLRYSTDQAYHVGTAGGSTHGYPVRLASLKLGGRSFLNVRAVVISGDSPAHVLLGMNVLREFDIEQKRDVMVLRSKH